MLCPHDLTKGGLKLRGSKAPRRTVAIKKAGKQIQLAQLVSILAWKRWNSSCDSSCNSYILLKVWENAFSQVFHYIILRSAIMGSWISKYFTSCLGRLCPIAYQRHNTWTADGKPHQEDQGTQTGPLHHRHTFCIQSKWIHVVLLTRGMLIGHRSMARQIWNYVI
jgi:hypothetical protein